MRLSGPIAALAAATAFAAFPPAAAAQSCDDGFFVERPEFVNTVAPVTLSVSAVGRARVEVDWGDGSTSSEPVTSGRATPAHQYRSEGVRTIALTATDPCTGQPRTQTIRIGVDVNPTCDERRDDAVFLVDCEEERGTLYVRNPTALSTTATWTNPPCNDQLYQGELVGPAARSASCAAPIGPTPVAGRLPVRPGRRLDLELSIPATAVSVRLGSTRGPAGPRIAARRVRASGLNWRLALPAGLDRRATRLYVAARRAGGTDGFVAGLGVR